MSIRLAPDTLNSALAPAPRRPAVPESEVCALLSRRNWERLGNVEILCARHREVLGWVDARAVELEPSIALKVIGNIVSAHLDGLAARYNPTLSDFTDWGWFDVEASA